MKVLTNNAILICLLSLKPMFSGFTPLYDSPSRVGFRAGASFMNLSNTENVFGSMNADIRLMTSYTSLDSTGKLRTKRLPTHYRIGSAIIYNRMRTGNYYYSLDNNYHHYYETTEFMGISVMPKAEYSGFGGGLGIKASKKNSDIRYYPCFYARLGDPQIFYFSVDNSLEQLFCMDEFVLSYGIGHTGSRFGWWVGFNNPDIFSEKLLMARLRHDFKRVSANVNLGRGIHTEETYSRLWASLGLDYLF